jgi:phage terminase large subunit-like protein
VPPPVTDAVRIAPDGVPDLTLGWQILDWQYDYLRQPDGPDAGSNWTYTPEQLRFVLWWYAIDENGRWAYRRGVLRRMKGWGKDPLVASLACTEFVGPCRFGGWDAHGQPVAIPHSAPWVQVAAVSKDQTRTTMTLFPGMLSREVIDEYGIDICKEIIYNRTSGRIEAVTSSPRALEGGRPTFVILNETHHWLENNEGHEMARTVARNLAKSRDGSARNLAITNAHDPGENSVAEWDWEAFLAIRDGRSRATGYLYDSREAPAGTQLADRESLRTGLLAARGDSSWLDVDRLIEEIYDPATPPSMSRRFYLNQLVASEDAWLAPHEWGQVADATKSLGDGDTVTLGFDGSVRDDSTALVACRVEDGHLELLGCWEKPDGPAGDGWQVDRTAVDAAVFRAFERFKVVGFYADPAFWADTLDRWSAEFAPRMLIRASQARPLEWWTNRPKAMVDALERFHEAVVSEQLSHSGDSVLTRHVLNSRRRVGRSGITISKENPSSNRKIDAAMAAVLAYECRGDAVTAGFARPKRQRRAYGF